jgi:hypothetical protein
VAPPKCAKPNYLRRIAKSWDAAGIVVDCGVERSMPLPDGKLDVPVVCIDLDPQKRKKLLQRGARSINVAFVNADSDLFARMAANELLNISDVKASFVLTCYNDEIYISARAIDEINVQVMMEKLGGGGHLNIAGAQMRTPVEEAKKELQRVIDETIEEAES